MSKIQNHIIEKNGSQQQNSRSNQSCPQQIHHTKNQQNPVSVQSISHKFQRMDLTSNHQKLIKQKIERLQMRFSRFKPWNLIQCAENIKVDRQSQENRATTQKNLQQSNQLISQSDYQFGSPLKIDANIYSQQKADFQLTSAKKQSLINTNTDKKTRPKQKGLRKLSEKAYNIVKQLGETTYKQVAIKLIQQIQEQQLQLNQQKQQNNIKRRVYDALNVLIAMKFLKKKGRNIVYEADSQAVRQQNLCIAFKQRRNQKMKQLLQQAEKLKQKKQEIRVMKTKIQVLKALLERNKKQSKTHPETQKIQFPFVCLIVKPEYLKKMQLINEAKIFKLPTSTQNQHSFFGDVDFLLRHPNFP